MKNGGSGLQKIVVREEGLKATGKYPLDIVQLRENEEKVHVSFRRRDEQEKQERLKRLESLDGYRVRLVSCQDDEDRLVQAAGYCFECGDDVVVEPATKEFVCVSCGTVWGKSEEVEQKIPFDDSSSETAHSENQYNPEGHMDLGKNLGGKVNRNLNADIIEEPLEEMPEELRLKIEEDLFLKRLLGVSINNNSHDPFTWGRTNQLRLRLTDPLTQKFLMEGRRLCNKYDLHKRGNVDHICFGDQLAIQLRRMADWYNNGGSEVHFDPVLIAMGLFCLRFQQTYPLKFESFRSQKGAVEKYSELFLSPKLLVYFDLVYKSCRVCELPVLSEGDVQIPYKE